MAISDKARILQPDIDLCSDSAALKSICSEPLVIHIRGNPEYAAFLPCQFFFLGFITVRTCITTIQADGMGKLQGIPDR